MRIPKSTPLEVFRIFEVAIDKSGNPQVRSLFHGTRGSRTLPLNEWIEADLKRVRDGSGNWWYTSGFHVFLSKSRADDYLHHSFRSTNNRFVLPCYTRSDLRVKRFNSPVYLVSDLFIDSEEVAKGVKL